MITKNMEFTTMEFYSNCKRNEIFSFAGKWMELGNITVTLARFRK
jgi:hypothetical protein